MPEGIGIVDLMLGFPIADYDKTYDFLRKAARDKESKESFRFPVEYMFKGVPYDFGKDADPLEATLSEMDKWGIERAMIGIGGETSRRALREHPKRFIACAQVDINDKRFFPLYAKACELGVAFFVNAGVPGPRVPMHCQHVEHLDEVCWFFPELTLVTYHGCEPWQDLMVKLMLKWPGLHYATSAFAPRYYPKAIIDYANTRGADKVLYAGYFPMGLSLERIMTEMRSVPFRDPVWPKFLRENALRVLRLDA